MAGEGGIRGRVSREEKGRREKPVPGRETEEAGEGQRAAGKSVPTAGGCLRAAYGRDRPQSRLGAVRHEAARFWCINSWDGLVNP